MTDEASEHGWLARLLLAGAAGVYLVASLYPFRWDPPRRVTNAATRDGTGIAFPDVGVVTFTNPGPVRALVEGRPVRLDLELSAAGDQDGPARILSLSDGIARQDLVVGQSGTAVVVRVRRPGSAPTGTPEIRIPGVFDDADVHRVRVLLADDRIDVEADGQRRSEPVSGDWMAGWDPDHALRLGNEYGGSRAWRGHLAHATVTTDDATIDLLEVATIPATLWVLPDRLADPPRLWTLYLQPVELVHALAMGAIAYLGVRAFRVPRARILAACWGLAGATLAAKLVVASRHPGVSDLAVEMLAAGVVVATVGRGGRSAAA